MHYFKTVYVGMQFVLRRSTNLYLELVVVLSIFQKTSMASFLFIED